MRTLLHLVVDARRNAALLPSLLLSLAVAAPSVDAAAPPDPVDVIAYGTHLPAGFTNPFEEHELSTDPYTRIRAKVVSALTRPLGTTTWGNAAWGKYVFLGNYDEAAAGGGQNVARQAIGVFDSELQTFCEITLASSGNGGVEFLAVANPTGRVSRIFYGTYASGGGATAFGWVDGDLDDPAPCTSWTTHPVGAAGLNAAAPSGVPAPCTNGEGCFDGVGVLRHEPTPGASDPLRDIGRDTVVLNNWFETRVVVAKVDEYGALTVPDVHPTGPWNPPTGASAGVCFAAYPTSFPSVDRSRNSSTDMRFMYDSDFFCSDAPNCTYIGYCPVPGPPSVGACTPGDHSCLTYCETGLLSSVPNMGCTTNADCVGTFFGLPYNLGNCVDDCIPNHPGLRCSNDWTTACVTDANCPTGATCQCANSAYPNGIQEFKFDGSTITDSSRQFASSPGTLGVSTTGDYDADGTAWLVTGVSAYDYPTAAVDQQALADESIALYPRVGSGTEHAFSTSPLATSVPYGSALGYDRDVSNRISAWVDGPTTTASHPDFPARYLKSRRQIRAARKDYGVWHNATGYKIELGFGMLPFEPVRCGSGSNIGLGCTTNADCPGYTTGNGCVVVPQTTFVGESANQSPIPIGGSPSSLWHTPLPIASYPYPTRPHGTINSWLVRVPIYTNLPDNASDTRPSIAWSGNRLWLVSEHGGSLSYRTRDQGLWSAWAALPSGMTGGGTVIANGSEVRVFARSSSNSKVYFTTLTSSQTCAVGSCSWSAWTQIASSPTTDVEVGAAYASNGHPVVVLRRNDGSSSKFALTRESTSGAWSNWTNTATTISTLAPSVAIDASDVAWVTALRENGDINVRKVSSPYTSWGSGSWSAVGTSGTVPTDGWRTAPAIAWDGTNMRVFAGQLDFPQYIYQTIGNDDGWSSWRQLITQAIATYQPTATAVGSTGKFEANVISKWYLDGLVEQAME